MRVVLEWTEGTSIFAKSQDVVTEKRGSRDGHMYPKIAVATDGDHSGWPRSGLGGNDPYHQNKNFAG